MCARRLARRCRLCRVLEARRGCGTTAIHARVRPGRRKVGARATARPGRAVRSGRAVADADRMPRLRARVVVVRRVHEERCAG